LFSPQTYFRKEDQPGQFSIDRKGNRLEFGDGKSLTFQSDLRSNLPVVKVAHAGFRDDMAFIREVNDSNDNLSEPQKEVL
jgi:hypothetical protein